MNTPRYRADELVRFATALLDKAGLESDKSKVVAQILVEGDLLGRVRLSGETGLRRREKQLEEGVELYPSILSALQPWSEKLRVAAPTAVG